MRLFTTLIGLLVAASFLASAQAAYVYYNQPAYTSPTYYGSTYIYHNPPQYTYTSYPYYTYPQTQVYATYDSPGFYISASYASYPYYAYPQAYYYNYPYYAGYHCTTTCYWVGGYQRCGCY